MNRAGSCLSVKSKGGGSSHSGVYEVKSKYLLIQLSL